MNSPNGAEILCPHKVHALLLYVNTELEGMHSNGSRAAGQVAKPLSAMCISVGSASGGRGKACCRPPAENQSQDSHLSLPVGHVCLPAACTAHAWHMLQDHTASPVWVC